jgi:hypothetical protein
VAVLLALLAGGCDLGVQQRSAVRTMSGVTNSQVASAAQGVFVDEGFDLAAVSSSAGFVRTVWREDPRRQLMFTVSTEEVVDEEGNELRGVKQIAVQGFARDRLVGGWSEEYQTDHRIHEVLDAVADRLTDSGDKQVRVRCITKDSPKSECKATADCPDGEHCADERCVSECKVDSDCEEGQGCDYRGRCVTPPLEPEPCPAAPAPATAAEGDTDSADDAEGEAGKSEEVAP